MNPFRMRWLAAAALAAAGIAAAAEPLTAEIAIRADQPGTPVSPALYGIFFEDINYAADGGLYAEMVQNRSFEYYPASRAGTNLAPTAAWERVQRGGRTGELKVEIYAPLHPRNPNYAVVVLKGDAGEAGLANTGYGGGIPVAAGATYDLSLYARAQSGAIGPLRVALERANGEALAAAELKAPGAAWAKQEVSLTPAQGDPAARLVITTASSGTLCLDMVSLFPRDTFKGRKNGLRKDLAQAIADLHPRIVRFPGGCLVHGAGLDNAYFWKETVGPVEQRRPKWNRWGYHQTFGLGYFEFFQYCEDIGADALPILPAGVSCGFTKPFEVGSEEQIQDMIQDAIDLVEFANGPADSRWGRVRAEMGHPAPFGLKYVGLGNEEHDTTSFRAIFPRFVTALRAKHPEIRIVGTSGLGPGIPLFDLMEATGVDISDEHYYEKPEWFIENRNRFDAVKRGQTKIFVGEYASKGNRQFNAVAEAVYLAGIERNADHVVMGAYAPLLARYEYTQWTQANLIWFDNAAVVKTPNYWVQQLFSTHLGDRYLSNTVAFAAGAATADGKPPVLAVSPTRAAKDGTLYLKLANPMAVPVSTRIAIQGLPGLSPQAELIQLAAAADAQNDRADPARVAPAVSMIAVGPSFTLEVPSTSVQVLTLRAATGP
jgi:alpha-L-arabinofuranosidase